ncbi:MAG TPA: DinB family protein [Thermoanaerobaculia bacterium]|nr:DinB family protein [Thermoanaerobaculia bacterium]
METFEEYSKRLRELVGPVDPMEVQANTADVLSRLLADVPDDLLRKPPRPGKWSVGQILGHLAEGEMVLGYRIRCILANNGCAIEGYDQSRWAEVMQYEEIAPPLSLERFRALREWNLALLRRLTDEEWKQFGIHSERGAESIRDMVALYAGHDLNHLGQIRAIVSP